MAKIAVQKGKLKVPSTMKSMSVGQVDKEDRSNDRKRASMGKPKLKKPKK